MASKRLKSVSKEVKTSVSAQLECIEETRKGLFLRVRVQPGASANAIDGMRDGALKIRISAPPVEGAANKAVIDYLSGILNVRKSALEIASGQSSRAKRLKIDGVSAAMLGAKIQELKDQRKK